MPLINGAKFLRMEHAGRFVLPPEAKVVHRGMNEELVRGDYIKLAVTAMGKTEKFWAKFDGLNAEGDIHCTINNDLELTAFHGLSDGESMLVPKQFLIARLKANG